MSTRKAVNAVPVTWNILSFSSFAGLDKHHEKTIGYSREYWKKNILLKGHPVLRVDGKKSDYTPKTRRLNPHSEKPIYWDEMFSIDEVKDFVGYVMVKKGMLAKIGIDEMLNKFKISIGRK